MEDKKTRRSRLEIYYDILEALVKEGEAHEGMAKKTRIMQAAHMDWRNFDQHFSSLIKKGHIEVISDSKGGEYYQLSQWGATLKTMIADLLGLLGEGLE